MQNADRSKKLEAYIKDLHSISTKKQTIQDMIADFSQDETFLNAELTRFDNFDQTVQ